MVRGGKFTYLHQDGLGSVTAATDARGVLTESYRYRAFGEPTITDATGRVLSSSRLGNPYLYTGREYDTETGLYHYRRRSYNPGTGRFTTADPFPGTRTSPQSFHRYSYVENNPINRLDPFGLRAERAEPPSRLDQLQSFNTPSGGGGGGGGGDQEESEGRMSMVRAINEIAKLPFGQSNRGDPIVDQLREAYHEDRLGFADLNPEELDTDDPVTLGGYFPSSRTIRIDPDFVSPSELPGVLAHEGTHMVLDERGHPYNFSNERRAFDSGYLVDLQLGNDPTYVTNDELRRLYRDHFD